MFFFCIKQRGKVEFYYCPLSHLELRTFDGAKVGKKGIRITGEERKKVHHLLSIYQTCHPQGEFLSNRIFQPVRKYE